MTFVDRGLLWGLLTLIVMTFTNVDTAENNSEVDVSPPLREKPRPEYKPHGIKVPTAPYPRGWNGIPNRYPSRRALQAFDQPGASKNLRHLGYQGPIVPHQRFRPRQQYAAPMNPWYGLPVPTAMGPYSHRRPLIPMSVQPQLNPQGPLAPLRDLDPTEKSRDNRLGGPVPWQPHDTWQGAQDPGHVVRPPSPDVLGNLVPPHMRVKTRPGADGPDLEEVGYVDAPEQEETEKPRSEETTVRVSKTSTKPSRVYLWRPTIPIRPPPALLGNEDAVLFLQEPSPDDNVVLTEEELAARPLSRRGHSARSRVEPHIANSLLL